MLVYTSIRSFRKFLGLVFIILILNVFSLYCLDIMYHFHQKLPKQLVTSTMNLDGEALTNVYHNGGS